MDLKRSVILSFLMATFNLAAAPQGMAESAGEVATDFVLLLPISGLALIEPGHRLELECLLNSNKSKQFKWYKKEGSGEREMTPVDDLIEIKSQSIILNAPDESDVGDYSCKTFSDTSSRIESASIQVRLLQTFQDFGLPRTSHLPNSTLVQEGQRVEMLCGPTRNDFDVSSFWRRSPSPKSAYARGSERIPLRLHNSTATVYTLDLGNSTSKLVIESASLRDRQYYTCLLGNPVDEFARERQIYLRVRPRSMLIWPSLGIFVELILLLLFIFTPSIRPRLKLDSQKQPSGGYKCVATLYCAQKKQKGLANENSSSP